jgi:hypothetical protein
MIAGRPLFTNRRTTASPKPDAPPVTKKAFIENKNKNKKKLFLE